MKKYSYIIIDDDSESILKTKTIADGFSELAFVGSAMHYEEALNLVFEHKPSIIFLEIAPEDLASNLSLSFISELYRYLLVIPKIIITTSKKELAFDAIQYGVFDFVLKPILQVDLLKILLRLDKYTMTELKNEISALVPPLQTVQIADKPLILCIKSYGDYRYINAADICYFQADNNSTDIYLSSGEMITAFKTLKHFEFVLMHPFVRIHNSYIINKNYISRIHNGHSVCYIKNSSKKIPFSKTYKSNVDSIISDFSAGNYLEL
ncbi:LytTR family two component transcriptional regulator [Flavobacterium chryseum]|uniref:LytR/AlgR family response regulator transcription factor n=1 Tax=Flavobacterium sp. P3160 TaxID=2512113 RepID=UPI00105E9DDA|nr:LytTR family DNA-binding domain-containing protein [Flavobacterium sp. P3160]TDO84066.1 LytTR family two component transcriptional regulator [Flavobacterium sp. P3160]